MREIAVGRARRATLAEDDDVGVAGLGVEHILDEVQHVGARVPAQRATNVVRIWSRPRCFEGGGLAG